MLCMDKNSLSVKPKLMDEYSKKKNKQSLNVRVECVFSKLL
jgi:hypothetical protein